LVFDFVQEVTERIIMQKSSIEVKIMVFMTRKRLEWYC
jgi:hypothetical protein